MSERIPLFPLHTVLLPNTDLGVHVFEPRFRDLVADCLDDSDEFGIALARPRVNGSTQETPHVIGTSARIAGYARLPDGRYLLEVEGSRRFRILDIDYDRAYPSALVDWMSEEIGNFATAREAGEEVESMVFLYRALDGDGDLPVRLSIDPVVRSYQVASLLHIAAGVKQSLLEEHTAADRLEREREILRREISLLDMARSGRS